MRRRLPKEPSAIGMIFTAISGTVLGLLLGAFILIKEVPMRQKNVSETTSSSEMGNFAAYYTPGAAAGSESATVKSRISRLGRQMPGEIPFTEMEVNHYLSQYKSAETNRDGSPADLAFSSPNVRMEKDEFVLSSKLLVRPKAERFEIIVQAVGRFENSENGVDIEIERLMFNSLVLPKFGGYIDKLFRENATFFPLPTEVRSSLGAIKQVELLDNQIVIAL